LILLLGGQGDILTGVLAALMCWSSLSKAIDMPLIAYGGSFITKKASSFAFNQHGRSMTASDMLNCLGTVFRENFDQEGCRQ
jgi:NAD(P)H-hydrate repair Nnr-like enzyme with NAD(P)H-hydrate dehydratase domain